MTLTTPSKVTLASHIHCLHKAITPFLCLFLVCFLSACGGKTGSQVTLPHHGTVGTIHIHGDTIAIPNQSVGIAAVRSHTGYNRFQWQQVQGEPVNILADKQAAINLILPRAGTYQFKVTASINGKQPISNTHTILVKDTPEKAHFQLRADRVAPAGGLISLRLYTEANTDKTHANKTQQPKSWHLKQTAGSKATIKNNSQTNNNPYAQISLPRVNKDEVLVFESVDDAGKLQDKAYILVQPQIGNNKPYFCDRPGQSKRCVHTTTLAHHYAYKPNSAFANVLVDCVISHQANEKNCTLQKLPFIGQTNQNPSINDIMNRVVVTHDWMGKNFEQFLKDYDHFDDFKQLFRSVNAIVISDNVKPSFFWAQTGTIYIDANDLWLTPSQRDSVTERLDYRQNNFISELSFKYEYDYVKNNKRIFDTPYHLPIHLQQSRTLDDIAMPFARLMYHELAHATDFFPNDMIRQISVSSLNKKPAQVLQTQSKSLQKNFPIKNKKLKDLTGVFYFRKKPTAEQKSFTAAQISEWFYDEQVNTDYAFINDFEDYAMLFEEAMMLTRFGVERYHMVMDKPAGQTKNSVIMQGQKNRITTPNLYEKTLYVVQRALPPASRSVADKLASMQPTPLCKGVPYFKHVDTQCKN